MLGSFPSTISRDHQSPQGDQDQDRCHHHHPRQLLVRCAELISSNDISSAHCILSFLRSTDACSPYGDSIERLSHLFVKALSFYLTNTIISNNVDHDYELVNSAYLSLNQVTPFIRFSHLTANQAILESVSSNNSVHILDFNLLQGLQWPPLMQALITSNPNKPPPTLRITATGSDLAHLQKTGSRLKRFANSLGLKFHFHPVHLSAHDPISVSLLSSAVNLLPGETLAVNAVHFFHRLLDDDVDRSALIILLDKIKSMNPKVVTISEREASHSSPNLGFRVEAGFEHYGAIFESMEATLPPNSKERMEVEQSWFGKEIVSVVSRRTRHVRFSTWEEIMKETGFKSVALSGFSVSQAKLLLRLHYPSEGYRLQVVGEDKCMLLGWKNHSLFSVSSWR